MELWVYFLVLSNYLCNHSPFHVHGKFRFFSSLSLKKQSFFNMIYYLFYILKSWIFDFLPQFKNGWTIPRSLADRGSILRRTQQPQAHRPPIILHSRRQFNYRFCSNGALIPLLNQFSFQSKIKYAYQLCHTALDAVSHPVLRLACHLERSERSLSIQSKI